MYPDIRPTQGGFIAHINAKVSLPGIFLTHIAAERAVEKYLNTIKAAQQAKRKNKE